VQLGCSTGLFDRVVRPGCSTGLFDRVVRPGCSTGLFYWVVRQIRAHKVLENEIKSGVREGFFSRRGAAVSFLQVSSPNGKFQILDCNFTPG
jgi:hypothetical protein